MAKRITKRMLQAAQLLASGEMSPPAVAAAVGVSDSTIYRWMQDEDVMDEYRACLRRAAVSAVAKAQKVLERQLDSDSGKGFLAQNAANSILNRSYSAIMKEDKQEITVRIMGYTPQVGMPDRSEDE